MAFNDMKKLKGFDATKYQPVLDELEQQVKKGFDGIYNGDEAALVNAEKAIANKRTILLANPFLDGDKVLAARFKLGVNAHKAMAPDLGTQGNNWSNQESARRMGFDADIVELSNLRGEDVQVRSIYKPENGMLNSIIGLFRDMTDPILWKGEKLVIPSIIIAMVWQAVGYYMVMYMASMSSVPASLYESANLDGAGRLTQFFQITIPLIWTNIRTTLTFFIISTINMAFLFVKAMTSGGPNGASDVALSYMYSQKDAGLYGYSMAIGVVIFLFSFALSACVNKATSRDPLEF